jgi:branched-chain amino acid transport system substrate-binding protein
MRQAASLHHYELPMLQPGITVNTSSTQFDALTQFRMERFDDQRFIGFGPILTPRSGDPGRRSQSSSAICDRRLPLGERSC